MVVDNKDWVYGEPTTGTVERIVRDRGFAFVRAGKFDYFMHQTDLVGDFLTLKEHMVVTFTPVETPKGLRACYAERAK